MCILKRKTNYALKPLLMQLITFFFCKLFNIDKQKRDLPFVESPSSVCDIVLGKR